MIDITRGVQDDPFKCMVFGPEGCGKTTLASGAPKPIFYDPNGRTGQVDLDRVRGSSWPDLMTFIEEASQLKEYETIVLDELSTIESHCWQYICKRDKKENIEKYGYGKGYVAALEEFKGLLHRLESCGKNVILIGHSVVSNFKNPEGSDYHRFEIDLHKHTAGYLKKWCDAVLFYRYETWAQKDENGKVIGQQTGARQVHTRHRAAYDAKNSYDMPSSITIPEGTGGWSLLERYIRPPDIQETISKIEELLPKMKDKKEAKKYIEAAGDDARKLIATLDWMEKKAS